MTHNERVLELLSDGKPHSHHEGYRLNVMLHSRVADLRKQGHDIFCWREGDSYFYLLHEAASAVASSWSGLSPTDGKHDDSPHRGEVPPEEASPVPLPGQLSLEDAA